MPDPRPPVEEIKDGLSFSPETFEANEEATIVFNASKTSALYNCTDEVYAYIGVVEGADWMFVPADWNENIAKCKMKKEADNTWSITLSPSIRNWFGIPEGIFVQNIGIVIRNADGTKKGIEVDSFIPVNDKTFVLGEISKEPIPAGAVEGITIIDPATVTWVLYDKDTQGNHKDYAYLIGDFNDWHIDNKYQMKRDDATGCWWYTLTGLDSQKEYAFQYYVGSKADGTIRLADAYAEKILDPANDRYIPASTYPNLRAYPSDKTAGIVSTFQTVTQTDKDITPFKIEDPNNLIIYELLFRDFSASGDINGAIEKLDYLKTLGVNAIELMPVQEFDGNDSWGYNPCFYFATDKAYGTKTMYKQFIDACHKKGIAVILDVVYNHATGAHPFAKLYWNTKTNTTASNNPWFNVNAPHPYSVFHDFNHESPLVRTFVKRNLAFLLKEYKLDGFRFDLTKGFTQNNSTDATASNYDASRIAILKDYNAAIKAVNPDACVILEHFCTEREEKELAEAGMKLWRNLNNAYCQSAMGYFENSGFAALTTRNTTMPDGAWVGFMESHDEERAGYKQSQWGNGLLQTDLAVRMKQLAVNAAFFFTVPGPKMIWQFGELGYDISIEENGRTGKKPLKWDYYENAARKNLYDTYDKLMELRTSYPELFASDADFSWVVTAGDWTNGRFITSRTGDKALVVVGNFTNNAAQYPVSFPNTGIWYDYMDNTEIAITSASETIDIPANEFRLYKNFK
ncbi:alpha-amylase [termite gut metagenome]|uniref:Alpha-amylase n=1 Tax=termite gut metagenome TaxID=433724 RepID=A0A5J4SP09_9ZZZZ